MLPPSAPCPCPFSIPPRFCPPPSPPPTPCSLTVPSLTAPVPYCTPPSPSLPPSLTSPPFLHPSLTAPFPHCALISIAPFYPPPLPHPPPPSLTSNPPHCSRPAFPPLPIRLADEGEAAAVPDTPSPQHPPPPPAPHQAACRRSRGSSSAQHPFPSTLLPTSCPTPPTTLPIRLLADEAEAAAVPDVPYAVHDFFHTYDTHSDLGAYPLASDFQKLEPGEKLPRDLHAALLGCVMLAASRRLSARGGQGRGRGH